MQSKSDSALTPHHGLVIINIVVSHSPFDLESIVPVAWQKYGERTILTQYFQTLLQPIRRFKGYRKGLSFKKSPPLPLSHPRLLEESRILPVRGDKMSAGLLHTSYSGIASLW
jgi:hypothetical protein